MIFFKKKKTDAIPDIPPPPPSGLEKSPEPERLDTFDPFDFEKTDPARQTTLAEEQDLDQIKQAIENASDEPISQEKTEQERMDLDFPKPQQKEESAERLDLPSNETSIPGTFDKEVDEDLPEFSQNEIVTENKKGYTLRTLPDPANVKIKQPPFNIYIDVRDYGKIFREIKVINAFTKKTFNTVMKIKDISGNQNKLYQKFYDDLGFVNERLTFIDTSIFENT